MEDEAKLENEGDLKAQPQRPKFTPFDLDAHKNSAEWKRQSWKSWIRLLVIAAALLISGSATYLYVPLRPACDDPEQAYDASKDFVRRRLDAPSSASFAWNVPSGAKIKGVSCTYSVTAYVDAVNALGANTRLWYIAEMEYSKARRQWELENLMLDPPQEFLLIYREW